MGFLIPSVFRIKNHRPKIKNPMPLIKPLLQNQNTTPAPIPTMGMRKKYKKIKFKKNKKPTLY
jgi:hypothetical protein